jgi:hypothetical protein
MRQVRPFPAFHPLLVMAMIVLFAAFGAASLAAGPAATGSSAATACGVLPGDCDGNASVSVMEVQRAVNMYLTIETPACGVDTDSSGVVSLEEVQAVADAYLGLRTPPAGVKVVVYPPSVDLGLGGTQAFSGFLLGCGDSADVTWSVQEGLAGGSITGEGSYTAPGAVGVYHVVATGVADTAKTTVATVVVTQRTVLADQTVQPSAQDQVIEGAGGRIALEIPGGLLEEPVTVKIEQVAGVPTPPPEYTVTSPWYRVTVDGEPPPWGMQVHIRTTPSSSRARVHGSAVPDGDSTILTHQGGTFGRADTNAQDGNLSCYAYGKVGTDLAAAGMSSPLENAWEGKEHFAIHYFLTGPDAPPTEYQAENHDDPGVPDFVEDVGAFLERAFAYYTAAPPAGLGLRPPYSTTSKCQVYIGDYETSEWSKYTGSIKVANKFTSKNELGVNWENNNGKDKTLLQWEMAHELFHAVENQYRTIFGMGSVLWFTESLADFAAHIGWPDSQTLMNVKMVNYGNWLNNAYWDLRTGHDPKYNGAGFFDYLAHFYLPTFVPNADFMENDYAPARPSNIAMKNLLDRRPFWREPFVKWIKYFYFDDSSPLAQRYFPVTNKASKQALTFRNGTTGCPRKPDNRYAYEKDKAAVRTFKLGEPPGSSVGMKAWTGDYLAVYPNDITGLPSNDSVHKFQVEMLTETSGHDVVLLFFGKEGHIQWSGQDMPAKGTKLDVEVGRTELADSFYVLAVNPDYVPTDLQGHKHQVQVTPGLTITGANCGLVVCGGAVCPGYPYSMQIEVVGGTPPLTFAITAGDLPWGMVLNPETGLIAGTVPWDDDLSLHTFTIEVTDSAGTKATGEFSIDPCGDKGIDACAERCR